MMSFVLTRHANTRMHQRAVPAAVLELLLLYGANTTAPGHALRIWFDREARADMRRAAVEGTAPRNIERWFDVAAVVSPEGEVFTVMRT